MPEKNILNNSKDKAVELPAEALRPWQTGPWLNFLFQKEALEFSAHSKSLFSDLAGTNLMEIQLELKKLKQYMGGQQTGWGKRYFGLHLPSQNG